jgi:SNF2-related domain/SNF2 Helicase protein/Helicase conserved C-terminal domain
MAASSITARKSASDAHPRGNGSGPELCITPHGHLLWSPAETETSSVDDRYRALVEAFSIASGSGLLRLVSTDRATGLPPAIAYWRSFAERFVTEVCTRTSSASEFSTPDPPSDEELSRLLMNAPLMRGAEYLNAAVLRSLWGELGDAFSNELRTSTSSLGEFLKSLGPAWNLVGRVHFNLAENRRDPDAPFAFMATYTGKLSASGKAQHQPLGDALNEYAGASNKERLLSLLLPVQRAAEQCAWLKDMVASGEVYHPLRWLPADALQLLRDTPALEHAGVVVRMPATWRANRPPRPKVTGTVGAKAPSVLGTDALLDFSMQVSLDGEALTPAEIAALLAGASGLALIRGQWVEVDTERLKRTMDRFQEAERLAQEEGLSFGEAMRLLSGADVSAADGGERAEAEWSAMSAGPWLAEVLQGLRSPEGLAKVDPGKELRGTLRPYQQVGVRWMHLLTRLGLGACLADDMGLGKTIQVLSLLLVRKRLRPDPSGREGHTDRPSLLVVPASLLGNWSAEIERFAPGLTKCIVHPSAMSSAALQDMDSAELKGTDLVITTYGSLFRLPWMAEAEWDLAIIDEAQAIKNPGAKQTKAVKKLKARARIALTGTPIENRLTDLWSIFDFIDPGLLGSAQTFTAYAKRLNTDAGGGYGPLRELVRPYILRRLKSDKSIIADLPDKTEVKAYCHLGQKQAVLYQQAVKDLTEQLQETDGIQRRGVVLSFLMRFKQLCNHPSQWLGDQAWAEADSGKWARLREIAEVVAAKQEKMLLFTQFREVTAPLADFLGSVFGKPGLVLHGGTPVKKRAGLVKEFQQDETIPFFVLSLKAGGSGLNLTSASHVVHFDRWWNPAVEDQATDRAYRIGQKRNVLVHKFICKGTVEDKIDELIGSKQRLSRELLAGGEELDITSMKDDDLLNLFKLDLGTAINE